MLKPVNMDKDKRHHDLTEAGDGICQELLVGSMYHSQTASLFE